MKIISAFIVFISMTTYICQAQLPDTDIFLVDIVKAGDGYKFSDPKNITNRKGYDNQPCFIGKENDIIYVVVEDTTQSDLYMYRSSSKKAIQLTQTRESEYSPFVAADNQTITVVRVDADSGQRLYNMKLPMLKPELIENSDSVGYFAWMNDSTVAMFILGKPFTLELLNTKTSKRKIADKNPGRCLKMAHDNSALYYVSKSDSTEWHIMSMTSDMKKKKVANTLKGSEDFAIMQGGEIIMGSEGKLYQLNMKSGEWRMIADFTSHLKGFYRIVLNRDGTQLALVAYTGDKP
jgi:hypothetical protein